MSLPDEWPLSMISIEEQMTLGHLTSCREPEGPAGDSQSPDRSQYSSWGGFRCQPGCDRDPPDARQGGLPGTTDV